MANDDMIALQEDFAEFRQVVKQAIEETREQLNELTLAQRRMETVIFGNQEIEYQGLTGRMKAIEAATAEMIKAEQSRKDKFTGITIGLTLTSIMSGITAVLQIWGG